MTSTVTLIEQFRTSGRVRVTIDADRILEVVADFYHITVRELRSQRRTRHIAEPRQVAAWIMRDGGMSFTQIASRLCRDHTTIIHSCRAVEARRAVSEEYRVQTDEAHRLAGLLDRRGDAYRATDAGRKLLVEVDARKAKGASSGKR